MRDRCLSHSTRDLETRTALGESLSPLVLTALRIARLFSLHLLPALRIADYSPYTYCQPSLSLDYSLYTYCQPSLSLDYSPYTYCQPSLSLDYSPYTYCQPSLSLDYSCPSSFKPPSLPFVALGGDIGSFWTLCPEPVDFFMTM